MIEPGIYHNPNQLNIKTAYIEINYTAFPGSPDYDGGLPGVGITWGQEKMFVTAKDEKDFWSQWPYSIFRPNRKREKRIADREKGDVGI